MQSQKKENNLMTLDESHINLNQIIVKKFQIMLQ